MTKLRTLRPIMTLTLILAVAAGCGEPEEVEEMREHAAPAAQPETAAAPADLPETRELQATLSEWSISLARQTMLPGSVEFVVTNTGEYQHAFEVEGGGQEWVLEDIQPGATDTLQVTLEPGTYEVYCPLVNEHGDHAEQGMRTSLTVEF